MNKRGKKNKILMYRMARYFCFILLTSILAGCGKSDADKTESGGSQSDNLIAESQQTGQQLQETINRANALLGNRNEDNGYTGKYLSGYHMETPQYEDTVDHAEETPETQPESSQNDAAVPKQNANSEANEQKNNESSGAKSSALKASNTGKYTPVTIGELYKELDENALRAETNWSDKYVAIIGQLSNIDNDGKYFSISDTEGTWRSVTCDIGKKDQVRNLIKGLNTGDEVLVYGQISSIGEVLGYYVDVDKVETNAESNTQATNANKSTNGKYTVVTVAELENDLSNNAMRAESDWKGKEVQVTGYLSGIDSDGKYFNIAGSSDEMSRLDGTVSCDINKNEAVKTALINKNMGDKVVVSGKITVVGEIMGIQMDVDKVE